MVDAITIIIGIIFILIIAIIITGFFYFNTALLPTAIVTDFGLTIKSAVHENLYMSMETISISGPTGPEPLPPAVFPIMSLKGLVPGQSPEPTEGWILQGLANPVSGPTGTSLVTFFNPSNGGNITYNVNSDGTTLTGGFIGFTGGKPPDPNPNDQTTFIGWFEMQQAVSNNVTITTFKSKYPGPIGPTGQQVEQYLIPGAENSPNLPNNPSVQPVIIGPTSNGNNGWIVGSG